MLVFPLPKVKKTKKKQNPKNTSHELILVSGHFSFWLEIFVRWPLLAFNIRYPLENEEKVQSWKIYFVFLFFGVSNPLSLVTYLANFVDFQVADIITRSPVEHLKTCNHGRCCLDSWFVRDVFEAATHRVRLCHISIWLS